MKEKKQGFNLKYLLLGAASALALGGAFAAGFDYAGRFHTDPAHREARHAALYEAATAAMPDEVAVKKGLREAARDVLTLRRLKGGNEEAGLAGEDMSASGLRALMEGAVTAGAARDQAAKEYKEAGLPLSAGFAGKFLASHFAQQSYDWDTASEYLDLVIADDPQNVDLIRRAMVLAMGTRDAAAAAQRARDLLLHEPDNGFAHMIIAVEALGRDDLAGTLAALAQMPEGDMTSFAKPLILGWAEAGAGNLEISGLAPVPMHLYHGALMAFYLGDKEKTRYFIDQVMQIKGLTQAEALRVADMLAALGEHDKAVGLYQGLKMQEGAAVSLIERKSEAVQSGDKDAMKQVVLPLQIERVQQGAALALYDMAVILFQEESDSSTKLFTQMALAVDPGLTEARLLLGEMLVRNERLGEAIEILETVPVEHPAYLEAQRLAAELMAQEGRQEEALAKMDALYEEYQDVEALIRIGDIYRMGEDYAAALKAYDRAVAAVGVPVPEEYWHLLYARGMVNEREGKWKDAVADLSKAIDYRPNHPYLLNYLGYGWADKGENLEESLILIRRAVALRPRDGYITDSLGWVLYRMQKYEEAVPHLEKAVELLPYDATINDHLGDAYWQVGRRMEARFQWRRALNSNPDEELAASITTKLRDGPGAPETLPLGTVANKGGDEEADKVKSE